MDVLEKIDKIFTYIEKQSNNSDNDNELVIKSRAKEREEFTNVLIDNLRNKIISYDEAVARAKKFAKSATDLAMIMARLGEFEVVLTKNASIQNSKTEVDDMDHVKSELDRLRTKLPKYAAWLENLFKRQGWNLGTGDKIPVDEYDTGVMKEEEKRVETGIKEGEKLMKEYEKEREHALRASFSERFKTAEKKEDNPRESTMIGPDEYDNGAAKEDDKRWKTEVKEGEKLMKEHEKERERVLRATKEMFDVRFVKDYNNVRNSAWQIIDKSDGKIIVSATLDDITDGHEMDKGALEEAQSPAFGEVILEEIADHGLISTARSLLGPKFEKISKEVGSKGRKKLEEAGIEDPDNPFYSEEDEDDESFGLHMTDEETEKETQAAEEEGLEGKHGIEEDVPAIGLKTEEEELEGFEKDEDEEEEKIELLASKYFQYKGIISELKPSLLKFARDTKVRGIEVLLKRAEQKLDEVKSLIEEPAPANEIGEAMTEAVDAVGKVSNVSDLIEKAKELSSDNPQLLDILDQIAEAVAGVDTTEIETEEISTETPSETSEFESSLEEEIEEEKMGSKDKEKSEEKGKEKAEKKDVKSILAERMRKLAKEKGDYDVTPKANFEKEFHGDDKNKITAEGNHFHTIWELAKELEALGGKKATGKLAKIILDMKKFAESKGIDPKEYFNKILEDSKYVNEYFSKKTPDSVIKEWTSATKDTADVYASLINRVKLAYKTALDMQKKGILKQSAADLDAQIDRFLSMDEASFNAYVDSLEAISPTAELEDGRFKVAVLDHPTPNGSIIQGYVDGIPVCGISGQDVQVVNGRITKESLHKAINLVKAGLDQGLFDSILSNNAAPGNTGGESDLKGLNLGISDLLG